MCLNLFLVSTVQVGSGSGFKNSDLLDPDPVENGLDPQLRYAGRGMSGASCWMRSSLNSTISIPSFLIT